jgi:hypothetical protein
LRLALAAALCLAAGCSGPGVITAYQGSAGETGTIVTAMREDAFRQTDNLITSVDGTRYEKGGYTAHVQAGPRRIGVQGTLRGVGKELRIQHCSFDLNIEGGCTYRPSIPAYPRSALDQPATAEWRLTRSMTVYAQCADTSYALQVPLECSSVRP